MYFLCVVFLFSCVEGLQLFTLPFSLNFTESASVNPQSGQQPDDTILLAVFRDGDFPLLPVDAWNMGEKTGSPAPSAFQLGLAPSIPFSTSVSYFQGTFSTILDLVSLPLQPGASLGTVTLGYDFSPQKQILPWAQPGAALDMSVFYKCPMALKASPSLTSAVYSSWSLGLRHRVSQTFVWYETLLFDLHRPLGSDIIWMDTITGSPIVHSVLSHDAPSAFHNIATDSSPSNDTVSDSFRLYHFSIAPQHIVAAMSAANAKFNLSLGTDPADWKLVHTNIEAEGTAGGRMAHSLKNMQISWLET